MRLSLVVERSETELRVGYKYSGLLVRRQMDYQPGVSYSLLRMLVVCSTQVGNFPSSLRPRAQVGHGGVA
jgi:hypothetical protein